MWLYREWTYHHGTDYTFQVSFWKILKELLLYFIFWFPDPVAGNATGNVPHGVATLNTIHPA
jgi:hypothetical protein